MSGVGSRLFGARLAFFLTFSGDWRRGFKCSFLPVSMLVVFRGNTVDSPPGVGEIFERRGKSGRNFRQIF